MDDRGEIRALLERMSAAWAMGDLERLAPCIHADAVLAAPGIVEERIVGREAILDAYRSFVAAMRITDYAEEAPWISVWGPTATASVAWLMAWEDEDGAHGASGLDVYALTKTADGWQVVGRLFLEQTRA